MAPTDPGRRRTALGCLLLALYLPLSLWCVGAMWFLGPGPRLLRATAAVLVAAATPWAFRRARSRLGVSAAFLAFAGAVALAWHLTTPKLQRNWAPEVATLTHTTFEQDRVHVAGVRFCKYRDADDFDVEHENRTYDLNALASVEFLVEPFGPISGIAHTLLTFGFDGGEYLAISVEVRRERGVAYHPIAGLFRQYELIYVIGDERDLIKVRTNHRRDEVYLYPIRTTPAQRRALLLDMLERANRLRVEPEFYNSLTSTCTTNIVDHINRLAEGNIPFSYRVFLPGFADELAWDLGLIDTDLPFPEARRRFRIDPNRPARGGRSRLLAEDPRRSLRGSRTMPQITPSGLTATVAP